MNCRRTTAGIVCMMLIISTGCGNKTAETAESAEPMVGMNVQSERAVKYTEAEHKRRARLLEAITAAGGDRFDADSLGALTDFCMAWNATFSQEAKDNGMRIDYTYETADTGITDALTDEKDNSGTVTSTEGHIKYKGSQSVKEITEPGRKYTVYSDNDTEYYDFDNGDEGHTKYKTDIAAQREEAVKNGDVKVSPELAEKDTERTERIPNNETVSGDELPEPEISADDESVQEYTDQTESVKHTISNAGHDEQYDFTIRFPVFDDTASDIPEDYAEQLALEQSMKPSGAYTVLVHDGKVTQLDYTLKAQGTVTEKISLRIQHDLSDLVIEPPADAESYPDIEDMMDKAGATEK